jgi:peptidyl-prolyl cis-trans isomerase SurA
MRTVGALVVLLVGSSAAVADDGWVVVDRIVAVVDQEVILASDVDRRLIGQGPPPTEIADATEWSTRRAELARSAIAALIEERLYLKAARREGIEVSPAEIDAAIEEVKRTNQIDDAGLAAALAEQGYTLTRYRDEVAQQILQLRVVQMTLRPRVHITERDVRAAWREARGSDPTTGAYDDVKVGLRELLFERELAERRAEWLAELRAGSHIEVRGP